MKLYDVPRNSMIRVGDHVLLFEHLDGMYSYCTDSTGEVVHIFAGEDVEVLDEQ